MAYNNSHSVILGQISSYLDRCCRNAYQQGRADAIDEVIHILKHQNTTILENGYEYHGYDDEELEEIAEQLKERVNE